MSVTLIRAAEPTGLAAVLKTVSYRDWDLVLYAPVVPAPPHLPWVVRAYVPGWTCCGEPFWEFAVPPGWEHATPPIGDFWLAWLRTCLKTAAVHEVDHRLTSGGVLPFSPRKLPPITESC